MARVLLNRASGRGRFAAIAVCAATTAIISTVASCGGAEKSPQQPATETRPSNHQTTDTSCTNTGPPENDVAAVLTGNDLGNGTAEAWIEYSITNHSGHPADYIVHYSVSWKDTGETYIERQFTVNNVQPCKKINGKEDVRIDFTSSTLQVTSVERTPSS